MSSNVGNKEASRSAEELVNEVQNPEEIRITDKRRFTSEGEPIGENEVVESQPTEVVPENQTEEIQARLKESEEKRAEAERQVRELADRFRQAQAQLKVETEDLRSRIQRTSEQKLEAARGDIVASLLDTLDNLKRAIIAAEEGEKRESDFEALLEGVRATANMFEAKMQSLGLVAIKSTGEEFNPEIHEAVEISPVSKEQDNHVIKEFQTGYKFGDRLLRPARVRVGKAKDK